MPCRFAYEQRRIGQRGPEVLLGRLRVLVIAVSFTIWIQIAGAAVFDWLLRTRFAAEAPADQPAADSSAS